MNAYVILRWREGDDAADVIPHAAYAYANDARERIDKIGANPDNRGYEMRKIASDTWRMGPDEDEGFFGNRPVYFRIVKVTVKS